LNSKTWGEVSDLYPLVRLYADAPESLTNSFDLGQARRPLLRRTVVRHQRPLPRRM